MYTVSFKGNVDLALPDDVDPDGVDLEDAAFVELLQLIPAAEFEIEEIVEV